MSRSWKFACEKESTNPLQAELRYHKKIPLPLPGKPARVEFQKSQDVVWLLDALPANEDDSAPVLTVTNAHVGSAIPVDLWNTSATNVVWMTTWSPKGLSPARPVVVVTEDLSSPVGKAMKLS